MEIMSPKINNLINIVAGVDGVLKIESEKKNPVYY